MDSILYTATRKCKGEDLSSKRVARAVRELGYGTVGNENDLTTTILDALVHGGLADNLETVWTTGGPIRRCRWRTWAEIRNSPPADALRRKLRLEASSFRGHP